MTYRKIVHICRMVSEKDRMIHSWQLSDQCQANRWGYVNDLPEEKCEKS